MASGFDGNVAPAEEGEPFGGNCLFDNHLGPCLGRGVTGQECHADGIGVPLGEMNAGSGADCPEKGIGNLNDHAGTVTGEGVGATGAAMAEVNQHLEALFDDLVRLESFYVRDETYATGVLVIGRVIESLFRGYG